MSTLEGEVAVVTGASRGIGRAIAARLASAGAAVACLGRSLADLSETVEVIRLSDGVAMAVLCDVTSDQDVVSSVGEIEDTLGDVGILVNGAGIYAVTPFDESSVGEWHRLFDVNVFGCVRVTKAFLPVMRRRQRGAIINVASTAGLRGAPNQTAYNASKHALVGFTRSLALEVAPEGVRVNAVCPGFVATDMLKKAAGDLVVHSGLTSGSDVVHELSRRTPLGRLPTVEEVAAMVSFLASRDADSVTGQAYVISGGSMT